MLLLHRPNTSASISMGSRSTLELRDGLQVLHFPKCPPNASNGPVRLVAQGYFSRTSAAFGLSSGRLQGRAPDVHCRDCGLDIMPTSCILLKASRTTALVVSRLPTEGQTPALVGFHGTTPAGYGLHPPNRRSGTPVPPPQTRRMETCLLIRGLRSHGTVTARELLLALQAYRGTENLLGKYVGI